MASRIDVARLYARATKRVSVPACDEGPPGLLPAPCPVTPAELIAGDAAHLAARFRPVAP